MDSLLINNNLDTLNSKFHETCKQLISMNNTAYQLSNLMKGADAVSKLAVRKLAAERRELEGRREGLYQEACIQVKHIEWLKHKEMVRESASPCLRKVVSRLGTTEAVSPRQKMTTLDNLKGTPNKITEIRLHRRKQKEAKTRPVNYRYTWKIKNEE